ncbi:MAG: DegV family protein [Clostridia bacterium]
MERIKFVIDSSGDISPEDAERYNLHIVPLGLVIDGEYYKDRIDISPSEFGERLKTCKDAPTSNAVNPQEWYEALETYVKSGEYDRIIVTGVGTTVSSTLNSAVQARDMLMKDYPKETENMSIEIFNSYISTIGFGVAIVKAAQMHEAGAEYLEIKDFLIDWFNHVEVLYVAFSFELPKKSGRINTPTAYVGNLLNIRPIMMVKEGKFTLFSKARGDKNVAGKLMEIIKERKRDDTDFFVMTGTHPTIVQEMSEEISKEFGQELFSISEAGPCMTLNGGWDMFSIGYLSNSDHRFDVLNPMYFQM